MTEIAEVEEDRPVCRAERVESCPSSSSCREVEVNRCHIETVLVRKGRPVTECERVPRKYCGEVECEQTRHRIHLLITLSRRLYQISLIYSLIP